MKIRIIVAALIENNKDQILLGLKKPNSGVYPNTWHNAGGGVEEGETLEQALRREVREETSLEIESFEPMSFTDDLATRHTDEGPQEVYHIFLPYRVRVKPGKPKPGSDFEELRWFDKKELQGTKLNPQAEARFRSFGWIK